MKTPTHPRCLFTLTRTKRGKTEEGRASDALGYDTLHVIHVRNWRSRECHLPSLPPEGKPGIVTIHDEEWLCAGVERGGWNLLPLNGEDLDAMHEAIGCGYFNISLPKG